jgi:hypothetical protein
MFVAVPASPLKPSAAAISAITKNVSAQLSIIHLPFSETLDDSAHHGCVKAIALYRVRLS